VCDREGKKHVINKIAMLNISIAYHTCMGSRVCQVMKGESGEFARCSVEHF
jgi:hypothetical protein